MATIQEIQDWFKANPNASNAQIAATAVKNNVTPKQLAQALGMSEQEIKTRWAQTGVPLTSAGFGQSQGYGEGQGPLSGYNKEVSNLVSILANPKATQKEIWNATGQIANLATAVNSQGLTGESGKPVAGFDINGTAAMKAAANSPEWQAAVKSYNAGQRVPDEFVPLFSRLNQYYKEGQADPGNLQAGTAAEAIKQWGVDASPSFLNRLTEFAVKAGLAYVGGNVASGIYNAATAGAGTGAGASELTAEQLAGPVMAEGYTAPAIATAAGTAGAGALGANVLPTGGTNTSTGVGTGISWLDKINPTNSNFDLNSLSSLLGAGSGLYDLLTNQGGKVTEKADPFSPYRSGYAEQLQRLMTNPLGDTTMSLLEKNPVQASQSNYNVTPFTGGLAQGNFIGQLTDLLKNPASVTSLPGYQFLQQQGQQAVQRALAAQGRTVSGQELLALREQDQGLANQQYLQQLSTLAPLAQQQSNEAQNIWGQTNTIGANQAMNNAGLQQNANFGNRQTLVNQYNQQANTLAGLAGASVNPIAAQTLGQNVNQNSWQALAQGVGGLATSNQLR